MTIWKYLDMTIWKYELAVVDEQKVAMPLGAKILTVQIQKGKPQLWALVDTSERLERRMIVTVGTGNPYPRMVTLDYISTYQLYEGDLVFHVFAGR